MGNLEVIKEKLKVAGFSSFEDWTFDFRRQGAKNIGYFVKAKSDSTGQLKEKAFYDVVDPNVWPEAARDDEEQQKMMDVFRVYLLNNLDNFIG